MKKNRKLLLGLLLCILVAYFFSPFLKDYTKNFLNKYGNADFDKFRGTCLIVRSCGNRHEVIVHGSKSSISNGIVWFSINSQTLEFMPGSFRFTEKNKLTENEKNELLKIKELVPLFIEYRVRRLCVDESGNVFIGVEEPAEVNLIKPANAQTLPAGYTDRKARKIGNWYLVRDH